GLGVGRDPQRTPMQWSADPQAGFSRARPWLPLANDFQKNNVEVLKRDPSSILSLYRNLITLRSQHPALRVGDLELIHSDSNQLSYQRRGAAERIFIALNLGQQEEEVEIPLHEGRPRLLLSTHSNREVGTVDASLILQPDEGLVLLLE